MPPTRTAVLVFLLISAASSQTVDAQPYVAGIGSLHIRPGGFLELIGLSRTATTADTINTRFGDIPVGDTPGESLWSPNHSRLWTRADTTEGPVNLTVYLESDFLNPHANQNPYRWRQYWGALRFGNWEISGGREWSLLRPNRVGVQSDTGMMNTIVIEPAYHVGLVGSRNRQFRLTRRMGDYNAVVAWETGGLFLAKAAADKKFGHVEASAIVAGHHGQRGLSAAATLNITSRLRFVTQEYWSRRAAYQALGVVPADRNGGSTIQGFEFSATRRVQLYTYAGWVYAARSGGNRLVREYTGGGDYQVPMPSIRGAALFSLQFSQMDRSLWTGQSGSMFYAMYRFRYTFN